MINNPIPVNALSSQNLDFTDCEIGIRKPSLGWLSSSGALISGTAATFVMFVIMTKLISNPPAYTQNPTDNPEIVIFNEPKQTNVIERTHILPEPPQKMDPPPMVPNEAVTNAEPALMSMGDFSVDVGSSVGTGFTMTAPTDGDAMPIVRVDPKYPISAARDGIEGWVKLSFSIDKTGRVVNVNVVEAHPIRIFNKAAARAVKRWKYKPRLQDGKSVIQHNQQVTLDFKLSEV